MLTPTPFDGDTILPLADARVQVRLLDSQTEHDAELADARDAAIGWVESYTGRSLQSRTFTLTQDQFCSAVHLPIGPVTAVGGVSYYDSDGTDTALVSDDWFLGNDRLIASTGTSWPYADGSPGGVRITFTAGYALPANIPAYLMAATKLALAAFFEDRSNPDLTGAMRCADAFRPIL